jgi:hypothetical protein
MASYKKVKFHTKDASDPLFFLTDDCEQNVREQRNVFRLKTLSKNVREQP